MRRSLKTRVHEWAAERFSFVQYPNIRPISQSARLERPGIKFKHSMSIGQRIDLILTSYVLMLIGGAVIFAVLAIIWAVI